MPLLTLLGCFIEGSLGLRRPWQAKLPRSAMGRKKHELKVGQLSGLNRAKGEVLFTVFNKTHKPHLRFVSLLQDPQTHSLNFMRPTLIDVRLCPWCPPDSPRPSQGAPKPDRTAKAR